MTMHRARPGVHCSWLLLLAVGCAPEVDLESVPWSVEAAVTICPGGATTQGIDVSTWQGSIDWDVVAGAGYKFAIARINDGHSMDDQFGRNWGEIQRVGMLRGAYQFYEPAIDSAWQAQVVVDTVGRLGVGDLPAMLDVEWPSIDGTPAQQGIQTWVDIVTAGTGKVPMIYTALGYWNQFFNGQFSDLPLVVANWDADCPALPAGWGGWSFWQWTVAAAGTVPGIGSRIDLDVFNGTLVDLQVFAGATNGCNSGQMAACGNYGCGCADGQCNGVFCPGTGCNATSTNNCGAFGCNCVDGQCNGGFCPGSGCTAKESIDCTNQGCGCVDHRCSGGACAGTGCTARQTLDCNAVDAGCRLGQCSGPDAAIAPDAATVVDGGMDDRAAPADANTAAASAADARHDPELPRSHGCACSTRDDMPGAVALAPGLALLLGTVRRRRGRAEGR